MTENFEKRSLRRSTDQRLLTGVCGGIGEFLGVDANLVRLVFAVFTFFVGSGVLLYIIAWLVMPERGADASLLERLIRNAQGRQDNV
ncbi:phage shock protein C (PspC) family protein [Haloactinospora alba]|uniref:Phage shock protein C (PspC) family protein n=1 Tax=Haloactinospora alba TaxID=405555 RepID=A0A543NN91_9ACTN|nr:PspC domain-containing protein [Haloactinospora alba]TQN33301.1 phage shock protein C (PspC) family protein [Haloactinospora alba]